jgi:Flp pilus assembly protein TadD
VRKTTFALVIFLSVSARSAPGSGQSSFLMFPLENLTKNPALSWIGEAICQSVTEQIRMPGIEAFGREERLGFVEGADLPPNATLSRASMIRIAQLVSADRVVMGSYLGTEESLHIAIRVFDTKSIKLSEEIVASGSLESLPGMENDLAWSIVSCSGKDAESTRDQFRERSRGIPNAAYSAFIQSLASVGQEEQIRLLEKAVELHPDFPEARYYLGRYCHEQGDCPAAIRHLMAVGSRRPSYPEDQFIIGNCYLNLNQLDNAIRCYSAVQAVIQSAHALNNSGVANTLKGDCSLAVRDLMEALALSDADPQITLNLAVARHLQGDQRAARTLLDGLERSHPGRGMVHYMLSLVLGSLGEAEQSARVLNQARDLGVDPQKLSTEGPRGWMHLFSSLESKP